MSFWRTFGFHTVSAVENILDRESFTLEELLDEDEILQEVKSQNKKLLDFLTQPPTLLKLFEFVSKDCGEEADPKRRFKYPFLACEILCSEIWVLTEAIFRDESLLNVLFSFLDHDQPLNPLLASYTSRVAIFLLARRTAEVLAYIKKQDNIIPKFISYLGSASVMELLLKIIGSEESPEGAGVIQWLCGTDLVSSLLSKFDPSQDTDVHENAGQTLSDIIQISSHLAGSPLLAQLESEAFVNQLFKYILSGSNSVMLHGMTVLIELLKRHARDVHDDNAKLQDLSPLLSISMGHLEQFNTFLRSPPPQSPMLTTFGSITPLGFYRLKVVDFYQALMRTRYTCIDEVFVKLEILNTCLDLFFEYPWNNFLHATVEFIIQNVLEGRNDQLKIALLTQAKLLDRIVEANKRNLQEEVKPRSSRLGFMGFLTTISLSIANAAAASPKLEEMLEANSEWKTYVNTSLSEIRTIETKPLGGHRPANIPIGENSEGEDDPDTDSIFDRYKLGFTDDFPDDNGEDEYDDTDMNQYGDSGPFDSTAAFNSYDKSFLYDNEMLHDANSDDSDDDTAEGQDGTEWPQKQIADVGSSPTEEAGFDKRVLNHENTNQQSQPGSQTTNDVFSNSHASS